MNTMIGRAIISTRRSQMKTISASKVLETDFHRSAVHATSNSLVQNQLSVPFQLFHQHRPFSSSQSLAFSTKDLSSLISGEIEAEKVITNDSSLTPELSELKEKVASSWTIVDGSSTGTDSGGSITRLIKKEPLSNGAKVALSFHCQDAVPEDPGFLDGMFGESNSEDDTSDNKEEEEDETSPAITFDVTVSRAGTTLHLHCISEDAKASIESATCSTGDEGDKNKVNFEESFRGPDLEELPENVLESFNEFLTEKCGVDEDVAAFIAMYADYREQAEYLDWLHAVKKVVE